MKKIYVYLFILIFGFLLLNGEWSSKFNILPIVKKGADNIQFEVNSLKKDTVFYVHYRTKGSEGFQIRKMKVGEDGRIYFQLSTKNLYGKELEYYITQDGSSKENNMTPVFTVTDFTDKTYPSIYFMDENTGDVSEKKKEKIIGMTASLSTNAQLANNSETSGDKFTANGNFRLYKNINKEKYQFDFDSNFTYMNKTMNNESKVNLSNMMVRYKRGIHKIEAGDVTISNSEFTTSYLNRRGFSYILDHKSLYFSAFFTNSQQKKGFGGFGIPASDANIFGVVIGYKKSDVFDVKGLFMTGSDNMESKTISSTEDQFRNGSMMSVWSSLNLFKSQLTLKGEYAKSNFGKGTDSDSIEKESDTAFQGDLNFNYKVITGNISYKKLGSHFNSIANLFLQNDREGLNSGLSLTIKSFSLSINYMDQKTYIESTIQPMLNTKNLTTTLSWLFGNHISVGVDFGINNLDYDQSTNLQTGSTDMNTINYGCNLAYISGTNSFNFRIGKTKSKTFNSVFDSSISCNLIFGQSLSLNPSINYQKTNNFSDNSISKMMSANISSEITFIQETLSITFSGSYTKNDNTFDDSTTASANVNLNFYMAKIFKNKIQPTLSLKTQFQQSEYSGTKTDSFAMYLQADIAF